MLRENLIQVSEASAVLWCDAAAVTSGVVASTMAEDAQIAMRGPICVVDDDDWVCDSLKVLLETFGYEVLAFGSGEEFLGDDRRSNAKCLVIDQHMPGLDGLEVVAELRRGRDLLPTILITGRLDAAIAERADELGIVAVLEKPFAAARVIGLIDAILG